MVVVRVCCGFIIKGGSSFPIVAAWVFFHICQLIFSQSMLRVQFLIHYRLWIVSTIHCEVVVVDVSWFWVAVELFWPR